MPDTLENTTPIPYHKHPEYLALIAEQEQAYQDAADMMETARVTVKYGRLIQAWYLEYTATIKVDILTGMKYEYK